MQRLARRDHAVLDCRSDATAPVRARSLVIDLPPPIRSGLLAGVLALLMTGVNIGKEVGGPITVRTVLFTKVRYARKTRARFYWL